MTTMGVPSPGDEEEGGSQKPPPFGPQIMKRRACYFFSIT